MAHQPSDNSIPPKPSNQFKFPDVYLPADVAEAIVNKTISPSGFAVLMVVRALTLTNKWCWARNGYFAEAAGRSSIAGVSNNINELVEGGFLKQKWVKGRRKLRLAWSWTLQKTVRHLTENCKPPLQKTVSIKHSKKETKETKGDTPPSNGHVKYSRSARAAHIQLRDALKAENRITGNRPGSVQAFARLEAKKVDYQPTLDWFCRHCSKEHQIKLGLPSVIDGLAFCKPDILSWIQDCRRKCNHPKDPNRLHEDEQP